MDIKDKEKHRAASRKNYQENKEIVKRRAKLHTIAMRKKVRIWLHEYLKTNPCVDCGELNPIVLEFDHIGEKKFIIGEFASKGATLNTVIAEVAKCQVRCANCHRKKTYKERGHTHRN